MNEEENLDSEKRRMDWLNRLADEFLKLEPTMPVKVLPEDENCPEWVKKVACEFGAIIFPVAKLKEDPRLTPKTMGALLGHQCAMAVWTMEWLAEQSEAQVTVAQRAFSKEQVEKGALLAESMVNKWYPGIRRLAQMALCSTVDQTYEDMRDFLTAFSSGFARKPSSFQVGDIGNPTFEIYLFLLLFWRAVSRFKSVPELHRVLIRIFGPHRTGDIKRIEKICQRIGLHFRKPGRPPKTK